MQPWSWDQTMHGEKYGELLVDEERTACLSLVTIS